MISPHDPKTIYYGGNHLFKSTDRGDTWAVLGEDLTTDADRDEQPILGRKIRQTQRDAVSRTMVSSPGPASPPSPNRP